MGSILQCGDAGHRDDSHQGVGQSKITGAIIIATQNGAQFIVYFWNILFYIFSLGLTRVTETAEIKTTDR